MTNNEKAKDMANKFIENMELICPESYDKFIKIVTKALDDKDTLIKSLQNQAGALHNQFDVVCEALELEPNSTMSEVLMLIKELKEDSNALDVIRMEGDR